MVVWILGSLKCPYIPLYTPHFWNASRLCWANGAAQGPLEQGTTEACVMVAPSPPSLCSSVSSHVLFNFLSVSPTPFNPCPIRSGKNYY